LRIIVRTVEPLPKKPSPAKKPRPVTLITGASSGIGAALAGVFAEYGHELVLVARRKVHLDDVAAAIVAAGRKEPHVIVADLTRRDAPARLARSLTARGLEPANIVNNAGFGLYGDAADLSADEQLAMIDLNARALTDLSLRFVDSLARHKGGILNVGSVAGFLPGARMAVYFATKAYIVSLSEALSCELKSRDIRVSALCPGPVATDFLRRAGLPPGIFADLLFVPLREVAEAGYRGFMRGQRLIVPGFFNRAVITLERFFPGTMTLRTGQQVAALLPRRGR
jgi:short-subunit dehydrogenase